MSEELKPCPFCGETPDLPSGDGTYYVIECGECGGAVVGIQISDLMTIEERQSDPVTDYRYAEQFIERAKAKATELWNTRATPPAAQVQVEQPDAVGHLALDEPFNGTEGMEIGEWEFVPERAAVESMLAVSTGEMAPLMTVAQHERIVAALSADNQRVTPPEPVLAKPHPMAEVQGERDRFESWVVREWPNAPIRYVRDALPTDDPRYGEYCDERLQRAWVGWQARAVLSAPPAAGVPEAVHVLRKAYEGNSAGLFNSGAPNHIWSAAMLELFESLDEEVQEDARETVMAHADMRTVAALDRVIELLAAPTPPASEQQQAVVMPEDWADGLPPAGQLCEARIPHHTQDGMQMIWCEAEVIAHSLIKGVVYSWVKEPGTDGGFFAPMMLSFRRISDSIDPHLAGVNQGVTVAGNGGEA